MTIKPIIVNALTIGQGCCMATFFGYSWSRTTCVVAWVLCLLAASAISVSEGGAE